MNQSLSESLDVGLAFTRCWIVLVVAIPAVSIVWGALAPAGRPIDPIAITTIFVWWSGVPVLSLAAIVLPLFISRQFGCRRRILRANCLSLAAVLLILDFWAIGIGGGLKAEYSNELVVAAILLAFALCQFPLAGIGRCGMNAEQDTNLDQPAKPSGDDSSIRETTDKPQRPAKPFYVPFGCVAVALPMLALVIAFVVFIFEILFLANR